MTRIANAAVSGKEGGESMIESTTIQGESPLSGLMDHPAFEGQGRLLLPWYGLREDEDQPFSSVEQYMPYHSAFDIPSMLSAVNALIKEHDEGKCVFYPVYSETEMTADPSKRDVGLFFFRGKDGAPFVIVSPGGGFAYVGSLHESLPHAHNLSERGYNAFSLSYRAGSGNLAARDLAAAVRFVFSHAADLGVSVDGYSLWGSSAGARMASAVGVYGTAAFGMDGLARPAAIIMAYTGQSSFTPNDPPTFSVVGAADGIAPARVMQRRIAGLQQAGVPAEIEVFPNVGHGFGLGTGTSAEGWLDDAVAFWEAQRERAL